MLSGFGVGRIRALAVKWLKDRCVIEEEAYVTGEFGEQVAEWQVVASNVPCRMVTSGQGSGSMVMEAGAQETLKQEYRIAVSHEVALGVNQRILLGGVIYSIVRVEAMLTDEIYRQAVVVVR